MTPKLKAAIAKWRDQPAEARRLAITVLLDDARSRYRRDARALRAAVALLKANLGLTQRWANRPDGAVERCKAALQKRRRSNGVHAANYIRHIPRDFDGGPSNKTLCGRFVRDVNCVDLLSEPDASDVCGMCSTVQRMAIRKTQGAK